MVMYFCSVWATSVAVITLAFLSAAVNKESFIFRMLNQITTVYGNSKYFPDFPSI